MKSVRIALAGATGNIGREIIRLLEEQKWVEETPACLASSVSVGEEIPFRDDEASVEELKEFDFKNIDVAIFATDKEVSALYIPKAIEAGCKIVDVSALKRADASVPLAGFGLEQEFTSPAQNVSIADAPALILTPVLKILQDVAEVKHVTSTVLCSTSSAGKMGMDELFRQSAGLLGGAGAAEMEAEEFTMQVAFNCLPQVGEFSGVHSSSEMGMMLDANRLLDTPVPMSVTSVRVPTFIGVAESVSVEFNSTIDADAVRKVLDGHDLIRVIDAPEKGEYSTPYGAAETDHIYVSRIRSDDYKSNTVHLWLVGDNLRLTALAVVDVIPKLV